MADEVRTTTDNLQWAHNWVWCERGRGAQPRPTRHDDPNRAPEWSIPPCPGPHYPLLVDTTEQPLQEDDRPRREADEGYKPGHGPHCCTPKWHEVPPADVCPHCRSACDAGHERFTGCYECDQCSPPADVCPDCAGTGAQHYNGDGDCPSCGGKGMVSRSSSE